MFSSQGEFLSGSGRSISGITILKLVGQSSRYLKKFGGHSGACGLAVEKSKFKEFLSSILINAGKVIKPKDLVKKIKIDAKTEPLELNVDLYENLRKLEPFGMGNPKPVFQISCLETVGIRFVGVGEKHISIHYKKGNYEVKAIFFNGNMCDCKSELHKLYEVVFSLDLDTWQGRREIKLNIIDIKLSKSQI
jgi:single-stranded-DNA-specific exonuclease